MRRNGFAIGKNRIDFNSPVFTIAEVGSNFRISNDPKTNFNQALKLIDIAAAACCDCVKFQLFRASKLYIKKAGGADYLGKKNDIYNLVQEAELPYEWLDGLKSHCDKRQILFAASPFDAESADELEKLGVPLYKIASYSITDFPFLAYVAKKRKPMVLSTGASDLEEIKEAIGVIEKAGNKNIIILQCTAKYPASLSSLNLRAIKTLQDVFPYPIGLSDHSREPLLAPLGAVALGARVVEKHFTTDNKLPGPDHVFAVLPKELKEMVCAIRQMEEALGEDKKKVYRQEEELREFARHFIYSVKPIKRGERFTPENIASLRPGKSERGLPPKFYDLIIGKKAAKDIPNQKPIKKETVKW